MKKVLASLLACSVLVAMTGCGSSDSKQEFLNYYKNNIKEVILKFKKYLEEQNKEDITSN